MLMMNITIWNPANNAMRKFLNNILKCGKIIIMAVFKLLLTALLLVNLSCEAWAGSNFSTLSYLTKIINVDEKKRAEDSTDQANKSASSSLDFYKWILNELERNVEEPNLFYLDMALVSEQVKRFNEDPEFFNAEDRNELRLAVKDKDFVKARKLIKEASDRMQPGTMVFCSSEVVEL